MIYFNAYYRLFTYIGIKQLSYVVIITRVLRHYFEFAYTILSFLTS